VGTSVLSDVKRADVADQTFTHSVLGRLGEIIRIGTGVEEKAAKEGSC